MFPLAKKDKVRIGFDVRLKQIIASVYEYCRTVSTDFILMIETFM